MSSNLRPQLIRLDPGGRRVKSRIRTGDVAVFITEERALKVHTKHTSSVESISLVAGGANGKARTCSRLAVCVSARMRS